MMVGAEPPPASDVAGVAPAGVLTGDAEKPRSDESSNRVSLSGEDTRRRQIQLWAPLPFAHRAA